MKKLMVIAAVSIAAIGANASSVSWGLSSGTLDATKVDAGKMYMCYMGDETSAPNWDVLKTATTFSKDTLTAAGFKKFIDSFDYSATITKVTGIDLSPETTGLSSANHNVYYVCIDDGGKDIAYMANPKSVPMKNSPMTGGGTVSADKFSYAKVGGGDVPEPTSAMLLLIGVAGLALKRRQA